MTRPALRCLLLCTTLLALGACQEPAAQPGATRGQEPAAEPGAAEAEAEAGAPKIAADAKHDFGFIKASETVEHVFEIRNEGTADLKIENVRKT